MSKEPKLLSTVLSRTSFHNTRMPQSTFFPMVRGTATRQTRNFGSWTKPILPQSSFIPTNQKFQRRFSNFARSPVVVEAADSKQSNQSHTKFYKLGLMAAAVGLSYLLFDDSTAHSQIFPDKDRKKVLSLDGGGIRGIIPLHILREIEYRLGKEITSLFDFFSGTSTGGIITLGLIKAQPFIDEKLLQEKLSIDNQQAKALLKELREKGVINEFNDVRAVFLSSVENDEKVSDGVVVRRIKRIAVDSFQLSEAFNQHKDKIIELLKNPGEKYYRNNAQQFSAQDLLDLYENYGEKIFSPPEADDIGATEAFSMRAAEIAAMPALTLLVRNIYDHLSNRGNYPAAWRLDWPNWPQLITYSLCLLAVYATYKLIQFSYKMVQKLIEPTPPFFWNKFTEIAALLAKGMFAAYIGSKLGSDDIVNVVGTFWLVTLNHYVTQNELHGYVFGSRYSSRQLERLLHEYFGEARSDHANRLFAITTFDALSKEPKVFYHHQLETSDEKVTETQVVGRQLRYMARATSAAPTYFPPLSIRNHIKGKDEVRKYVDGGVFANNPAEIPLHLKVTDDFDYLLALGTGHFPENAEERAAILDSGALTEIANIIEIIMDTAHIEERIKANRHINVHTYKRLDPQLTKNFDLADVSKENVQALRKEVRAYIKANDATIDAVCARLDNSYSAQKGQRKFFWEIMAQPVPKRAAIVPSHPVARNTR